MRSLSSFSRDFASHKRQPSGENSSPSSTSPWKRPNSSLKSTSRMPASTNIFFSTSLTRKVSAFMHAISLSLAHPNEDVRVVDHGVVQRIIFVEELKRRRVELHAFFHTEAPAQAARGEIAHHALHRDHVEALHQRVVIRQ